MALMRFFVAGFQSFLAYMLGVLVLGPFVEQGNHRCAAGLTRASLDIASVKSQARQFQDSKNFEAATNLWQQFLQEHPESAEALTELGAIALSSGQYEDALQWFSRALELFQPELVSAKAS